MGSKCFFCVCRSPCTSGCILCFGESAFRVLSASMNDPSNVAAGAVSMCCSRVVCIVCRLSIPFSGTYIPFLCILYINLIYSVNFSQESIFISLHFKRLYFGSMSLYFCIRR